MVRKLNCLHILFLFFSNLIIAQEDLIEWVVPLENQKSAFINSRDYRGPAINDKIYFEQGENTIVFNLKNEEYDTISLRLGNQLFLTSDSLWQINKFSNSSEITNTFSGEKKSYPSRILGYIGNSMVQYLDKSVDSVYLVDLDKDKVIYSAKPHKDYWQTFVSGNQKYGVIDYINDKIVFYNLKGGSVFSVSGTSIYPYSGDETVYLHYHESGEIRIINERGKTIHSSNKKLTAFHPFAMIDQGLLITYLDRSKKFIDYEGTEIKGKLRYPTKMRGVKLVHDSTYPYKQGLFFENLGSETDIKYDNIHLYPRTNIHGSKDIIEAKIENRIIDYYNPNGKLIYTSGQYHYNQFLQDNFFLVGKDGYCGIINNEGKVVVPMKSIMNNSDKCSGASNSVNEKTYFYMTNSSGHLFVYNENGDELYSLTDSNYTSRTKFINEYLVLGKRVENGDLHDGMISLSDGELIMPYKYQSIRKNPHVKDENQDLNSYSFSLFHIPTRKNVLENCSKITFLINNYVLIQKKKQSGLIKQKY